jgi:hypothetical protein
VEHHPGAFQQHCQVTAGDVRLDELEASVPPRQFRQVLSGHRVTGWGPCVHAGHQPASPEELSGEVRADEPGNTRN